MEMVVNEKEKKALDSEENLAESSYQVVWLVGR